MQTLPVDYIPEFEDEDTTPQVRTMPVDYEPEFEETGDFIPGIQRGINQTQAMGFGSVALVGSALEKAGAESAGGWLKEKGMEGYRRNIEEAEQFPKSQSFKDVYTGQAGVGGTVDWVQGTLGELIPSMVEAATGAVIGSIVAPGPGTGAGAFGARTILKRSIDKLTKEAVKAQVQKGIVEEGAKAALEQQIRKEVTKQSLKKLGGKAGMGAAVLPMEAGGSYAGLLEEHGIDNPASALFFGALATSLEFAGGNSRLIDAMVDGVARGNGGLIKRAAKEVLTNAPQEALQEGGQEALQILNTVVNTDEKFLTPQHVEEIIEGAGAGLVGGVGGGVARGVISKDSRQSILDKRKGFDSGVPDETTDQAETPSWETEFDTEWKRRTEQRQQQTMGRPAPDQTDIRIQQMRAENQRQMERMGAPPDYDLKGSVNLLESNVEKFRRLKSQEESVQALQERQQNMGRPGLYQPPAARVAQSALQRFESRPGRHLPPADSSIPIIEGGQAPFIPVPGARPGPAGYYPFADLVERLGGREKLLGPESETPSPIVQGTAYRSREHEVEPDQVNTEPTDAQKSAGNYKKDHIKIDGLDISIENPAGSTRKGKDRSGKQWETAMQSHYGYFKRSTGKDGDQVDVFVKPDTETSPKVFVVDQVDPDTGQFDEHKVVLGAETEQEARDIYQSNYEDGWQGLGGITEMDQAGFKEWLKDGTRTKQPVADQFVEPDEKVADVQESLTTEQPVKLKPGQPVTWKTQKGKTLTGTLSRKVKTNWFVEKPDGKRTLVPEKQLAIVQGKAKLSTTSDQPAEYTPGQGLDLKDIQSRFKGQRVFLSPDNSVSIRMKNGMGLKIKQVRAFSGKDVSMAMEVGRMTQGGAILGKYESKEITLNRDLADTITRDHELYHFLAENLLTKGDRLAIKAKARAYHKAGKFQFKWLPQMEENEANAFAQFLQEREQHRDTPLGRAIQKIVDFFDGLVHIGRASARKLAREVESGKVFERKDTRTNQGESVGKLSTSSDLKNATDDIALEYGMDTPKLPKADGILSDPATDSIVQEDTGKLAGNPVLRLFESVADRFERSKDLRLKDLGKRLRDYFDRVEKNAGMWRGALKPHMDKIQKMPRKQRQQFYKDFETYWRHHDNGRRDEAKGLLENKDLASLVEAVKGLYHESGVINQKLGIMVQDEGKWRPIGKIMKGFFWPRVLKKDVSRVLYDADYRAKHPELWEDMVNALVNDGYIKEPQEALKYLSEYFSGESSNDFFANLEKARGKKLPEMFYDYSVDVVQMYANKWSQRSAQIEFFGQETTTQKDRFTTLLNSSLDLGTKEYIKAVRDTVYNVRKADIYGTLMDYMNIFATATQLGNPGTALLNVVGGTLLNVQHMGIKNTVRAVKELTRDWKAIQQEGTELGILGKDLLNLMRDLDAPATDMFTPESKIKDVLAKFADITMTWGGYKVTENFIRSTAMVAAKYQLQDALSAWNKDVNSAKSKVYIRNFTKNGIDWKQLARENGSGEETGKYLRKMVNIPQGSYKIDQTPLYVDTRAGRFFFKYQKFGTQVSKMFYDNFFHPFMKAKDPKARTRHFVRMMGYFAYAIAGGSLILTARAAAFGYNDPRPEDEDIAKAFENDDLHRGWGLILSKAWHNMMAASAFGFFGNYIQFGMDIADQQRVKNPLDPPGLATIDAPIELVRRGLEQGRITGKDLSEVLERSLAIYRANKRLTTGVMAELGSEWKHARLEAARRDRRFIQKTVRRFAEEYDIQKKRTSIGRIGATPMTPINKQLYDALVLGNSEQVRQIVSETIRNAKPEDWKKVRASMMASARARQPLSINGTINEIERAIFYSWAMKNLSRASYERIRQADLKYRVAMVQAGLAKKVGVIPPASVQSP